MELKGTILPAVLDLLGKAQQVFYDQFLTTIQDNVAREMSKDLVLPGLQKQQIGVGIAIKYGLEIQFEATIIA